MLVIKTQNNVDDFSAKEYHHHMRSLMVVCTVAVSAFMVIYMGSHWRRATRWWKTLANTTDYVWFPDRQPRREITDCYGHRTVTDFAVVTTFYTPHHPQSTVLAEIMACKLAKSIRHFTNADLLLVTSHASNVARECGWSQCLYSVPDKLFLFSNPLLIHLSLIHASYTKILFLDLHTTLPVRQFASDMFIHQPAQWDNNNNTNALLLLLDGSTTSIPLSRDPSVGPILFMEHLKPYSPISCLWENAVDVCLLWLWL